MTWQFSVPRPVEKRNPRDTPTTPLGSGRDGPRRPLPIARLVAMPTPTDPPSGDHADPSRRRGSLDREILALALPALGALVAEPVFVLVDSAVVGSLGTSPLAGLSLASTILLTVIGLCVFLAYATTATVARLVGAGREREALTSGIDALWLAMGLGVLLAVLVAVTAPGVVSALGGEGEVATQAVLYLRWSAPGLPGMLLVLAATGVLRGLQDTRTPLVVAASGAVANAVLNVLLVLGAGLGIAGSGLGTATAQGAMALALVAVVVRRGRRSGASLRPAPGGILAGARKGLPLFVRTASLRLAVLLTVSVATGLGTVVLAGHQVVNSVWGLAAFALDALAIAAQALIGFDLGSGRTDRVREVVRRSLRWGVVAGAAIGLVMAAGGWWIAPLFTADDAVRSAIGWGMLACGLLMPVAGWVFVLDGVLIGAGDGAFLAWAGLGTVVAYVPAIVAVRAWAPHSDVGLAWLWAAFGVFILARAVTTGWRARGTAWMVTGA